MASSQAQLIVDRLNTNPQDRDSMLAFALAKVLASKGTDAGLANPVDDLIAQLEAIFDDASPSRDYVVQRVKYYLNSMRERMHKGQ